MFICLVNNEPKVLGLKDIIHHYIKHREVVVKRRTEFDLRKAEERAHIVEGLKIAVSNIDEVVRIIKTSENSSRTHQKNCRKNLKLSRGTRRTAILEMKTCKVDWTWERKTWPGIWGVDKTHRKVKIHPFLLKKNILNVVKEELIQIKKSMGMKGWQR